MNEKQRDGMERAGELVPQRRATDRIGAGRAPEWDDMGAFSDYMGKPAAPDYRTIATDLCATIDSEYPAPDYSDDFRNGMTCGLVKLNHRVLKAAGVAAAPVVAVVAADIKTWQQRQSESNYVRPCEACMLAEITDLRAALASQAQAAVSAPVQRKSIDSNEFARLIRAWERADSTAAADAAYGAIIGHVDRFAAQAAVGVASQQEQTTDEFARFVAWSDRFTKESGGSVMAPRDAWMAAKLEASQREQQPQPSCNAALRAAPEVQHDASIAALTTGEIVSIARQAYDDGRLAWAGFTENERGHFTVPMLSQCHFDLARAIEAELARRFRAPGGNTNDKASPDLASIASQAQGNRNAVLDEAVCAAMDTDVEVMKWAGQTLDDGALTKLSIVAAINALKTPTES